MNARPHGNRLSPDNASAHENRARDFSPALRFCNFVDEYVADFWKELSRRPEASFRAAHQQSLFDLDAQPQFDTVTLNLFGGCFWPCLAYGAKMLDNPGGGSIINFSSISAFTAIRGHIAYAAAKAGVSNFTQSLAAHLARDFNPKLRVNAVAPGFFPNNNPAQMLFNPDGSYRAKAQRGVDATPMHRMGHPNELIGTLVWLASDASSYVTGITVTVDGGYLLDSPA